MKKFDDRFKLLVELEHRGLDSSYNDAKEIRYWSDGLVENGKTGFQVFKLPNKNGDIFSAKIKIEPVLYLGYGNYNKYIWYLADS